MNFLKKYAVMTWDDCMKARQKLREDLALPPDEEEDKRACRLLYHLYFNNIVM